MVGYTRGGKKRIQKYVYVAAVPNVRNALQCNLVKALFSDGVSEKRDKFPFVVNTCSRVRMR
jgi:hypothetical protein